MKQYPEPTDREDELLTKDATGELTPDEEQELYG